MITIDMDWEYPTTYLQRRYYTQAVQELGQQILDVLLADRLNPSSTLDSQIGHIIAGQPTGVKIGAIQEAQSKFKGAN